MMYEEIVVDVLPASLCKLAELGRWRRRANEDVVTLSAEAAVLYQLGDQAAFYANSDLLKHVLYVDQQLLRDAWSGLRQYQEYEIEFRLTQVNGQALWLWEKCHIQYDAKGKVTSIDGVVQNISRYRLNHAA